MDKKNKKKKDSRGVREFMVANEVLKQYFGYEAFRDGQESIIGELLEDRDVLGIMPTGAGKSICFQVPALMKQGITIVISPLISLMQDQVKALNQAGVSAAYINSSLSQMQIEKALYYAAQGRYKIVYVAPERLLTEGFLAFAQQVEVAMLTVDEAHCISQWGQDFRPSYAQIPQFLSMLPKRPTVSAFTATATKQVKEDVIRLLELKNPFVLVTGFDRENLYFEVKQSSSKMSDLLTFLADKKDLNGVIYCATRKNVESVCEELQEAGWSAAKYHAGLSQTIRQDNQNDFIYDRIKIMVATNAFGMGIDKSNVNFVVHYNMPKDIESYYQEAGRAGRDGAPAHCLLLYSAQDVITQQWMIENGRDMTYESEEMERELKERDYKRLKEMTFYSTTNQCLRQYILRYFGEEVDTFCGNCGNCDTKFETIDVTIEAKHIIECVKQIQERFGKVMIIDVLRGSKTARVLQFGFEQLPAYGTCSASANRLRTILDHLILKKYLMQTDEQYSVIKLTERSEELLDGAIVLEMQIAEEREVTKRKVNVAKGVPEERVALYTQLRTLRGELANKERVPAFMVFGDATLIDMCQKLPATLAQFANVSGVGKKKQEKYGPQFIGEIVQFCEENNIILVEDEIEDDSKKAKSSKTKSAKSSKSKSATIVRPTEEMIDKMIDEIEITEKLASISDINKRINEVLLAYDCTKTSAIKLGDWLVNQGYLSVVVTETGNQKVPTELGYSKGIVQEGRYARGNTYQINMYPEEMQQLIVEGSLGR